VPPQGKTGNFNGIEIRENFGHLLNACTVVGLSDPVAVYKLLSVDLPRRQPEHPAARSRQNGSRAGSSNAVRGCWVNPARQGGG
jgi:hypothetical protein